MPGQGPQECVNSRRRTLERLYLWCKPSEPENWPIALAHMHTINEPSFPRSTRCTLMPNEICRMYLQRTAGKIYYVDIVPDRFFVHYKSGKCWVTASNISKWLVDCIIVAYKETPDLPFTTIYKNAHEIRAMATSWAYWNNATLSDVMSSVRCHTSLTAHYL